MHTLKEYAVIAGTPRRGRVLRFVHASGVDRPDIDRRYGRGRDHGHGPQWIVETGRRDVRLGDEVEAGEDGVIHTIIARATAMIVRGTGQQRREEGGSGVGDRGGEGARRAADPRGGRGGGRTRGARRRARHKAGAGKQSMKKRGPKPDPQIAERNRCIATRIQRGEHPRDVARDFGLNERYVSRICKEVTGSRPKELRGLLWPRDRVIKALREWTERNGRPPLYVEANVAVDLPAAETIMRALGLRSWLQVYDFLGFPAPGRRGRGISTDISRGAPTPDEVRMARTRLGTSPSDLAAMLGVEEGELEAWESGRDRPAPYLRLALAYLSLRRQ